jgi:hypothetical protein
LGSPKLARVIEKMVKFAAPVTTYYKDDAYGYNSIDKDPD